MGPMRIRNLSRVLDLNSIVHCIQRVSRIVRCLLASEDGARVSTPGAGDPTWISLSFVRMVSARAESDLANLDCTYYLALSGRFNVTRFEG